MGEIYFIELAKKFVWVFPVRYCGKNLNESFGQPDTWDYKMLFILWETDLFRLF